MVNSGKCAKSVAFKTGVGTVALTRRVALFCIVPDPLMVVICVGEIVVFSDDRDEEGVVIVVASVDVATPVDSTVVAFSSTDTFVSFTGEIPILTTALITTGIVSSISIRIRLLFIVVADCKILFQIDAKC